jgi:colicin import membrane protein
MDSPHQVPAQPGRWRAVALAVLVHLVLLAFLWIGIRWHNETPLTVEAEIWDPYVREAAPPQPESPKPAPTPPPSPKIAETPVAKPDIALEKEKEKQRRKQEEKEHEEREKQARLEQKERAKKEALASSQKLAKQKKDADDQKKADDKAAAQRRQDDLKRMMNEAGSSSGDAGNAAKSQGPRGTSDYASKLGAKIRSNTIFDVPSGLNGNPAVEYTVELLPDGSVRNIRKGKSSGLPGFDEAVQQALDRSQPFPPDKDGKVPRSFTFTHKPKDQ